MKRSNLRLRTASMPALACALMIAAALPASGAAAQDVNQEQESA